jgi:hypothetical protein
MESPKFTQYYKTQFSQIMDDAEFTLFENTLKQKLPVTFRLNSGEHDYMRVSEMLRDANFVRNYTDSDLVMQPDEYNSLKTSVVDYDSLRMDCKPYYPN